MALLQVAKSELFRDIIIDTLGITGNPGDLRGAQGYQGAQGHQGNVGIGVQGAQGFQGISGISTNGGLNLIMDTAGGSANTSPILGTLGIQPNIGTQTQITYMTKTSQLTAQVGTFVSPSNFFTSTFIPKGTWIFNLYAQLNIGTFPPSFYFNIYQVDSDGVSNPVLIYDGSGNKKQFTSASNTLYQYNASVNAFTLTDLTKCLQIQLWSVSLPVVRIISFNFRDSTIAYVMSEISPLNGAQGFQGNNGLDGMTGAQGYQGNTGISGMTGAQGFQGNNGVQGFQGNNGLDGMTGAQGFQGNNGITGAQGFQGNTGSQGFQGNNGVTGAQGVTGVQGFQGASGGGGGGGFTGTNVMSSGTYIADVNDNGSMSIFSNITNPMLAVDNPAGLTCWGNYISGYNANATLVSIGTTAINGCYKNTSIGSFVSPNIVGGLSNTLIGYATGYNFNSSQNASIYNNTIIGTEASCTSQNSNQNTIIGAYACAGVGLTGNPGATYTYSQNTVIGSNAGKSLTTGNANTLYSYNSATNLTTGSNNIICGVNAGADLLTGGQNIFIGGSSGRGITGGSGNICIGYVSRPNNNISNSIMINATGAVITNANNSSCIVAPMRNTSATTSPLVYNTSTNEVQYSTSSQKYKKNITDIRDTSNVFKLRCVEFDSIIDDDKHFIGFIAEEAGEIDENFIWRNSVGEIDGINHYNILVYLVNESKKLNNKIIELSNTNNKMINIINDLNSKINKLETKLVTCLVTNRTNIP